MKSVGVLALQGGFDPHLRTLSAMGVEAGLVRTFVEIRGRDALIIPGGESTTIGKLLVINGIFEPLVELLQQGFPVFGTCAGLILLSQKAVGHQQSLLGVLDVDVSRNAYGRQTESFETTLPFERNGESVEVGAVFIRAPQIVRTGSTVKILATYEALPVCVQQDRILACSFHPELTEERAIHDYFVSLV